MNPNNAVAEVASAPQRVGAAASQGAPSAWLESGRPQSPRSPRVEFRGSASRSRSPGEVAVAAAASRGLEIRSRRLESRGSASRSRSRAPVAVAAQTSWGPEIRSRSSGEVAVAAAAASDADIIHSFIEAVHAVQRSLQQTVRAPESIDPIRRLRTRMPPSLPDADTRFGKKTARVFVCDGCGNVVCFSSQKRGTTYHRIL